MITKLYSRSALRWIAVLLAAVVVVAFASYQVGNTAFTTSAAVAGVSHQKPQSGTTQTRSLLTRLSAGIDTTPDHGLVQGKEAPAEVVEEPVAQEPTKPDGFLYCPEIPMSEELQLHAYQRAVEKNIDYPILLALIWRESRFDPNEIGYNTNGTRDYGIMQINDVNTGWAARDLGITNLMDPFDNITVGTELLGNLVEKYGQHNALIAYQYGEAGMKSRVFRGLTQSSQTDQLYSKGSEFREILSRYEKI